MAAPGQRNPHGPRDPLTKEQDLSELGRLMALHPSDSLERLSSRFNASRGPDTRISRQQLNRDVKLLLERWRKEHDTTGWHSKLTRQILFAQQEFMDSWVASKGSRQITTTRRTLAAGESQTDASAGSSMAQARTEQLFGDATYLLGYLRCVDRLARLFGVEPEARRKIDQRIIREEVDAAAKELNMPADELMHKLESLVQQRWDATAPGPGSPLAEALALGSAGSLADLVLDDSEDGDDGDV